MQILIDRKGQETIRLTVSETRALQKAAALLRQLAKHSDDMTLNATEQAVIEVAEEYGPKMIVTATK